MKAVVYTRYGPPEVLRFTDVEVPVPKDNEVLVRVRAVSINRSDWETLRGKPLYSRIAGPFRPRHHILGSDIAGQVEAAGGHTTLFQPGDDVFADILNQMGGFAEYAVMPAQQVVPIQADVDMASLALIGCAVTTGVGAVLNTAKVESGSTVAVIGTGGVGLNVVQGAVVAGASRIFAIDLLDNKLDYAGSFGATDLVNGAKSDPVQQVLELTGGLGVDYVFEAIGNVRATEQAIQMSARGGTVTLVGMAPQKQAATFDPLLFVQKETRMLGCFYGSFRPKLDFLRYVDMVVKGRLKVKELISRRYALDEINEAYDRLGRGEVARSVITFPV